MALIQYMYFFKAKLHQQIHTIPSLKMVKARCMSLAITGIHVYAVADFIRMG